jgi:hypothetical protein
MNDNHPPASWPDRAVGFGAGLASALLFIVSTRGSSLAMALAYFAPLPLMIGAAGFSLASALAGALAGALLLAAATHPAFGLGYLAGFAAPAFILGVLSQAALPSRKADSPAPRFASPGELLAALALMSIALAWLGVLLLIQHYRGFDPAMTAILRDIGPALDDIAESLRPVATEAELDKVKRLAIMSGPAAVAASQALLLAVNLWLAARTLEISGRLRRPWPPLPETLALPRVAAPIFVVALALVFIGGLTSVLAGVVAAATGFALALQGLAAIHDMTRDVKYRGAWLVALYAAALPLGPWWMFVLALFGLIESVFSLRARKALATKAKK